MVPRSDRPRRALPKSSWFVAAALAAGLVVAGARAFDDGAKAGDPANAGPPAVAAKLAYDGGATCYVRVTDLGKSIEWFQRTLGLELLFEVDAIGWAELKSPAEKLTIGLLKAPKVEAGGGATIVFGVKDADAARKQLEAAGAKLPGPTLVHEGYVKLVPFLDPDGNLFTLSQSLAPAAGGAKPEGGAR